MDTTFAFQRTFCYLHILHYSQILKYLRFQYLLLASQL
nr:MAG TPA: hypothetical protein [Caudoviricetes sp.]